MTRPFDLEAAKAGAPVMTRSGKTARIVCFDVVDKQPLCVLVKEDDLDSFYFGKEEAWLYSPDGQFDPDECAGSTLDLVMT